MGKRRASDDEASGSEEDAQAELEDEDDDYGNSSEFEKPSKTKQEFSETSPPAKKAKVSPPTTAAAPDLPNGNLILAEILCEIADFSVSLANKIAAKTGYQWKRKKTKGGNSAAAKDPNAPRRPQTAFSLFSESVRKRLKEIGNQTSPTFSQLADMWKKAPAEKRQKFEEAAKQGRERYQEELEAYKSNQSSGIAC